MAMHKEVETCAGLLTRGDHFSVGNYHYVVLSNEPLRVQADAGEKDYNVLKVTKCLTNGTIPTRMLQPEEMIFLSEEFVDLHIPERIKV